MYKSFLGSTKQAYIALLSFMSRFCFVPSFDFYKTSSVIMVAEKSEEFVVVLFWSSLRNILSFVRPLLILSLRLFYAVCELLRSSAESV